jgi:hypothetical protein
MSLLNQIKTKKEQRPLTVLFYGVHGIGKTNFASGAENPIFIGDESNDEFDVARFPKIEKWAQLKEQLVTLINDKHDFKTVVIDTMDGLEQIAQAEILSGKDAGKTMATAMGGYGKAYEKMSDMFIDIRDNYLEKLRLKGIQVIILAHSEKSKFEDPILAINYDTYSTALHKSIKPVFQDWVSAILFANYDLVRAERMDGKQYAEGMDGERVIYTEERPSHVGKNRFGLPYELKFPKAGAWKILKKYVTDYYGKPDEEKKEIDISALEKEVNSLFEKIEDDTLRGPIQKSISRAVKNKDEQELIRLIDKIKKL